MKHLPSSARQSQIRIRLAERPGVTVAALPSFVTFRGAPPEPAFDRPKPERLVWVNPRRAT